MFYRSIFAIALLLMGACANPDTKTSRTNAVSERSAQRSSASTLRATVEAPPEIIEIPIITAKSPVAPKGVTAMHSLRVAGGIDRGRLETVVVKALMEKGYSPRVGSNSDLMAEVNVDYAGSELGVTVVFRSTREGELYWSANRGMRIAEASPSPSAISGPGPMGQMGGLKEGRTERVVEVLTSILKELPPQSGAAK